MNLISLTNRFSAAKGNTRYTYDKVGNLTAIDYSGGTSSTSPISLSYDALNRLTNMVDAVGTTSYCYDTAGQLLSEDGPWGSDTVSYTYQNRLRQSLSVQAPNASDWWQSYAYDSGRRMTNITSPAGAFGYDYVLHDLGYDASLGYNRYSASSQVRALTLPNLAAITNDFDGNGRLLSTTLMNDQSAILNWHGYAYNKGNQRTQQGFTAGNYQDYTYDAIGQLKTAKGKEAGGVTNRLHEQFGYFYDAAGNLNYRTNNGFQQTFTVNSLNELTGGSRSGTFTVAGSFMGLATNVTVNGSNSFLYADGTFASTNHSLANGPKLFTAVAQDVVNRWATNSVTVFTPPTPVYEYDLNGNLLVERNAAGTTNRLFAYDDENQLTAVWVTNAWKSEFSYDGKMRRRIRKEYTWNGGWQLTNEVRYVYDGNLVIQERDANNLPQVTYTRGNDLSGSLEGAGGIGGLLARTDNVLSAIGSPLSTSFYHCDGNGNVTALLSADGSGLVARYEYDPFGSLLALSGSLADANLYRFSSKEYHANLGLVYYLYRYYEPSLQRWVNRDPIEENGGMNLYSFVLNCPSVYIDTFGWQQNNPCAAGQHCQPGSEVYNAVGWITSCTCVSDNPPPPPQPPLPPTPPSQPPYPEPPGYPPGQRTRVVCVRGYYQPPIYRPAVYRPAQCSSGNPIRWYVPSSYEPASYQPAVYVPPFCYTVHY